MAESRHADGVAVHSAHHPVLEALRDGLGVLGDATVVIDRAGRVTFGTATAGELLGREDLLGVTLQSLAADSWEVEQLIARWWTTSSTRPGVLTLADGARLRCDGARLPSLPVMLVRLQPQRRATRPFSHVRVELEAQNLRQLSQRLHDTVVELSGVNRRLAAANDELDQYAAAVSHDLRTPLYTIKGYVELLLDDRHVDEDALPLVTAIQRAVQRLERTITALLSVARLESGAPPAAPVDGRVVLDQVVEALEDEIDEAKASIVIGDLPMMLVGQAPLAQVLQNLLANSLRYRSDDRRLVVEISGRRRDGAVEVTVADNGIGVPPGEHERVFELFHRGDSGRAGTGIGLTTCRKLVTQWGGRIRSVPVEVGARFEFTVPSRRPLAGGSLSDESAEEPGTS